MVNKERIQKLIEVVEKFKAFDQNEEDNCVVGIGVRLVAKRRRVDVKDSIKNVYTDCRIFANYFGVTFKEAILLYWELDATKEQMLTELRWLI